jgi:hypothetical protein
MASKNVGTRIAAGVAILVVVIVVIGVMRGGGDRDTDVVVSDNQGSCVVITKSDIINAKKEKFVNWIIENRCSPPGLVTVGNFRTSQSPSADNCLNATYGGATWPFQENENQIVHRQNRNRISLKIKRNADLPGGHTYYFDVCTGDNAERRSDPRLVIDP